MRYALPPAVPRITLAPAFAGPVGLTDAVLARHHDLMLARMAQTVLVDPLPLLRTIRMPRLLLWGERDALIPFANSGYYLKAIARSKLVALPGIGHLPQEEVPGSVEAMREFL